MADRLTKPGTLMRDKGKQMGWDTEVLRVLKEWDADQESRGSGYAVTAPTLEQMALIAARTLLPLCGAEHPCNPRVLCTDRATHVGHGDHRNDELGLSWSDDGITVHDHLGEIWLAPSSSSPTLVLDGDQETDDKPVDLPAAGVVTQEALDMLVAIASALDRVNRAYEGDSKRITASIYRATRDAWAVLDRSLKAVGAGGSID